MKKEKVSIIVPIYNVERYLEKCLERILNQTYENLEIILVDDGSTDKSSLICDKYHEQDCRIKVFHKKNEGVSIARNEGIKLSTGKYIVFIDADDYVSNEHIESLYKCIVEKNVDIVISNAIDITEDGTILRSKEKQDFIMNKEQCLCELLSENNFYHVCWGNIYKRELLENCRFNYKYKIAEDLDFLYRYISKIDNAYFLSKKTYYWVRRDGSATNSQYSEKWNDELEICKLIINKTLNLQNDLHKYAKGKYVKAIINQAQKFNLNKKQIKLFRDNIKVYKNEVLKHKEFSKIAKLKIILFLKSYNLFKLIINLKDSLSTQKRMFGG